MTCILSPVLSFLASRSLRIDSSILISAYSLELLSLLGTDMRLVTGTATVTVSVPQLRLGL